MENAALMFTGGLDSATLAYWLKSQDVNFRAIFLDQELVATPRELASAENFAARLGFPIEIIDTSAIDHHFKRFQANADIGACHSEDTQDTVPGIGVAIQLAIYQAQILGINTLYLGTLRGQLGSTAEAMQLLDSLSQANTLLHPRKIPFTIKTPFLDLDKKDIIVIGESLGVPFAETWTCLEGYKQHCGSCRQCNARRQAFAVAGRSDPTNYLDDLSAVRIF